jgi:hypothetical protein
MTTYLNQPDEDFPEQYAILKPSHREEDLEMPEDDRLPYGDLEDEYSDVE